MNPHPTPTPTPNDRSEARWWALPSSWVELFAAGNLGFLALDIYVAHSMNNFARATEWIPLAYSIAAPPLLALCWLIQGRVRPRPADDRPPDLPPWRPVLARRLGLLVGLAGVVVGVAGVVFHLQSHFFREQTLHNLVYTAPFAAPLSYAGLGLILVLNRLERGSTLEYARWVVLLAMGGFLGNFVLSLSDHAQNGFFHPAEWIPVVSAAYAVGALVAVASFPGSRSTWFLAAAVMLLQVVVGLMGFVYHLVPNVRGPMPTYWESFVYGAPIFAPMLFADLALLAGLGLWAVALARPEILRRRAPEPGVAPAP
ncbi:hypothetical protein [Tautonia plasticadhaerens]|uniref:Uncharacterized protein n=1 Tax=Tautonia plasticadhaerens TaxID=2527974 RepID=A0A518HBG5_9BACT|nr:hypothetical protein [Tautonia plasticadhaerens]QDV38202.1 hypothetical protein ElP_61530 [Tautonia plasticadhaerens]